MPQEHEESDADVLLAKRRCRLVLQILDESTTPLSAIRLARHIAERENENPLADDVTSIYLSLFNSHLPRLEALDVVMYDETEGTVHRGRNFDAITRAVEGTDDSDTVLLENAQQESCVTPRRIDLFVRACTPAVVHERFVAVIDRLDQLCDDGYLTDYRLRQWPPRGSGRGDSSGSIGWSTSRREIVSEFDAWAEERGYSLEPAFQRRSDVTQESAEDAGEHYTVPLLTLAFYEGETLAGVVPCADGHCTYTLADFLSASIPEEWIDLPDDSEQESDRQSE